MILIGLSLILASGCSFIEDSNAESEVQADLEELSDQELVELAEQTEGGQIIAGQGTRMSSWSRVNSAARSRMMVKELSRRLQKYSISDEPAFMPRDDGTSQQRGDGSVSISDEPELMPRVDGTAPNEGK